MKRWNGIKTIYKCISNVFPFAAPIAFGVLLFSPRALARFPTRLYNCVHLLRNTNKTYRRAGARVCEAGEPRAPSLSYSTDRNVVARRSGELCRRSHETPLIYRARERRRAREQKIQLTYTAT